ncbi:hypothetical protein EDC61_11969 [Sulfuritortus calidifontis]|uniref:DUF7210 domain-containing protein n=1 Tax=Sulfuritortus calidifontis TaxID=1914471 RepID=A0A4V2UQC9_9PROT|nr:hypothetical protein [Sulfuritortus calidifontis]TCS69768.1 hypothetical protein EDC61_11969 [Sulfuritortus calidifontis]
MKIELTQPHTHAGQPYLPGEVLDLPEDAARWLIEAGVAQPSPQDPLPAGEGSKNPKRKE